MYGITGSSGQLGQLVISALRKRVASDEIVALARDPAKATNLMSLGAGAVRPFDYDKPDTLRPALAGIKKLLLISSNAIGQRAAQHRTVIEAAKAAGVELIAYTSILHADTTPIHLRDEHVETETLLKASGLRTILLRNGWYIENYVHFLKPALASGFYAGSSGNGRISAAACADYAEAAAVSLADDDGSAELIHELAGDTVFTLGEFVAEAARQSGKPIEYRNVPEADFAALLTKSGLPVPVAAVLAQSAAATADDALFDDSRTLSRLIGHPTTPYKDVIAAALKRTS